MTQRELLALLRAGPVSASTLVDRGMELSAAARLLHRAWLDQPVTIHRRRPAGAAEYEYSTPKGER